MKKFIVLLALIGAFLYVGFKEGSLELPHNSLFNQVTSTQNTRVTNEESVIIEAIDKNLPSVVTIGIKKTQTTSDRITIDPFNQQNPIQRIPGESRTFEGNIGSGFAIDQNHIITNKHVVNDENADYSILTNDGQEFDIIKISKDPLNDLAIVEVETDTLTPIVLGESSNLKLGQIVIAIGTPLGQFTNTVTTGIISGLGRGITAGSAYEGFVERLDNVIQTDAAINPGNSGGPLINSSGEVIGINTAVSAGSENIGFAIPVNVLKELLVIYHAADGEIARPYIGIRYQMISKENAVLNEVPQGAYVVEILKDSPAANADIQIGDIITHIDGQRVQGDDDKILQNIISQKKIGNNVDIELWRDGKTIKTQIKLKIFE